MLKLTTRSSWMEFRDALAAEEDFRTSGALRGTGERYSHTRGQLPSEYWDSLRDAQYVVYSYATPIAWRTQCQWHAPAVRYSVTTSRHQGTIFTAIAELLR